ncbi:hypothetical protein [Nocardioides daphniae]|uniref:hypothetical protein n=1 Tax=Nocardioides daphniae TaxID=402297 RepID=UPI001E402390|nr:hypothetical protein [Nocardioides daphniae]
MVEVPGAGVAAAEREDAPVVSQHHLVPRPRRRIVRRAPGGVGEVEDWRDGHLRAAEPLLEEVGGDRAEPLDLGNRHLCAGLAAVTGPAERGQVRQRGVDVHLERLPRRPATGLGRSGVGGGEPERELVDTFASEREQCLYPPRPDCVGVPGASQGIGVGADPVHHLTKGHGVTDSGQLAGPGPATRVSQVDVPLRPLGGFLLLLTCGVDAGHRERDQPVQRRRADRASGADHLPVDPPCCLQRQRPRCGRDPAGLPHGDLEGLDLVPQPRQPVHQIHRVSQQALSRCRRDPQHPRQRLRGEGRHPRRTRTARELISRQHPAFTERGVADHPRVDQLKLLGLRGRDQLPVRTQLTQQLGGSGRVGGAGGGFHGSTQPVAADSFRWPAPSGLPSRNDPQAASTRHPDLLGRPDPDRRHRRPGEVTRRDEE